MSNTARKINLKPDEEIKAVIHRSLWSWSIHILGAVIFISLPFFLIFPLLQFGWWGLGVFLLLLLVGLFLILKIYINYRKNIFILTSKRIVDIDHQGLFSNMVSSTIYDKIQDVTYQSKGLLKSLWHLGDIFISFVGNQKVQLKLPNIKYPEKVVGEILANQTEASAQNKKVDVSQSNQAQITLNKIKQKLDPAIFDRLISDN